jgi:hypothetical protein
VTLAVGFAMAMAVAGLFDLLGAFHRFDCF